MASVRQNWMMRLRPRADCWLAASHFATEPTAKESEHAEQGEKYHPPPVRNALNIPAPVAALAAEPPLVAAAVTVAALAVVASSGKAAITPSVKVLPGAGLFQRAGDKGEELLLQQFPSA